MSSNFFECTSCGFDRIVIGQKFCAGCGARLDWPKKKHKARRKSIKLPIDPDKLRALTGIGVDYHDTLYFVKRGILWISLNLISIWMLGRYERKIEKWLKGLETKKLKISIFRKYIKKYRNWNIFIVANVAFCDILCVLGCFTSVDFINIIAFIYWLPSLFVACYNIDLCGKVLRDSRCRRKYVYEFVKQ